MTTIRPVINFTPYVSEDLSAIVAAVEEFSAATAEGVMQGWGRDRPIEFVPYAFSNSKRANYSSSGTVTTERRFVSEGVWGGTAFRIGLVDPRAAHSNPVAQLLGTDSLGGAPEDMLNQLMLRLTWVYPCHRTGTPNDLVKLIREGNPHLTLRFRPGLKSAKDENEKRLVRLLKARAKIESVMVQTGLLTRAATEAIKCLDPLASHLKGPDAVHIPVMKTALTEVGAHARSVEIDIVRAAFDNITAEALRLAELEG